MKKIKNKMNDFIVVRNFHNSIKSLKNTIAPKCKSYKVKITKDQMDLLYAMASQGIKNKDEYIDFMKMLLEFEPVKINKSDSWIDIICSEKHNWNIILGSDK